MLKFGFAFTGQEFALLILGCVVAFGVSVFAIKLDASISKIMILKYLDIIGSYLVLLCFCILELRHYLHKITCIKAYIA